MDTISRLKILQLDLNSLKEFANELAVEIPYGKFDVTIIARRLSGIEDQITQLINYEEGNKDKGKED